MDTLLTRPRRTAALCGLLAVLVVALIAGSLPAAPGAWASADEDNADIAMVSEHLAQSAGTSVVDGVQAQGLCGVDDPVQASEACPSAVTSAGFTDVPPSGTHTRSIDCVVWWGIANGTSSRTYSPSNAVTRGQLASFLAAALEASGADLGTPTNQGFTDVAGSVHADRINQLVGAGILNGRSATKFAPDDAVTRAQTATFLVAGYEDTAAATLLAPASNLFSDIAGHTHRGNINKAAAAEFVRGTSATTYHPDRVVTRDQLASFLVNLLERSVAEGIASPPG